MFDEMHTGAKWRWQRRWERRGRDLNKIFNNLVKRRAGNVA